MALATRIQVLFVDKDVFKVESTFCSHMVRFLSEPRTLFYNNEVRVLGGCELTNAIANNLERMKNWVHLAKSVIRAEFPSFEILQSFSVLHMKSSKLHGAADDADASKHIANSLGRFAKLLGLSRDHLIAEYADHKPIAQRIFAQGGMDTFGAWKKALLQTSKTKRCREAHPSASLRAVLIRFAVYGGSTSGVERLFASSHQSAGMSRADLSESMIDDELHLLCDVDESENPSLCKDAQRIWHLVYDTARVTHSRALRLDAGCPKAQRKDCRAILDR